MKGRRKSNRTDLHRGGDGGIREVPPEAARPPGADCQVMLGGECVNLTRFPTQVSNS